MKKLIEQIIKFGFVGFLCFFIDYLLYAYLTRIIGIFYLLAGIISFTVSVTVNYILSVTLVFETDKNRNRFKEFVVFVILSIIGLGLNSLCMWIGVDRLGIHDLLTKIGATAIVMVYNFITRKIFIEKKN